MKKNRGYASGLEHSVPHAIQICIMSISDLIVLETSCQYQLNSIAELHDQDKTMSFEMHSVIKIQLELVGGYCSLSSCYLSI